MQPNCEKLSDPVALAGYLGSAIGFFTSVIKSGEPWTATCQDVLNEAHRNLDDLKALPAAARPLPEKGP